MENGKSFAFLYYYCIIWWIAASFLYFGKLSRVCHCNFIENASFLFSTSPKCNMWHPNFTRKRPCTRVGLHWTKSYTLRVTHTLGMLTLDQNSSKCSLIFSVLYFEYRIASSVNMPMCALSRPVRGTTQSRCEILTVGPGKHFTRLLLFVWFLNVLVSN